jgi:hypothetical protein
LVIAERREITVKITATNQESLANDHRDEALEQYRSGSERVGKN